MHWYERRRVHDQVAVLLPGQAPPELGEAQVVTDAHADAPAAAREHARPLAAREAVRDLGTLAHVAQVHLVVDELDAARGRDDGLGDGEDRLPELGQEARSFAAVFESHVGRCGDGVGACHDARGAILYNDAAANSGHRRQGSRRAVHEAEADVRVDLPGQGLED